MGILESEVDRVLTLLRTKMRESGFTQLEVQRELGWGRSYISQLLTKQKALRVEQVLAILKVVGVDPADFFHQLFPLAANDRRSAGRSGRSLLDHPAAALGERPAMLSGRLQPTRGGRSFGELRSLVRGLVGLLVDKELIDLDELVCEVRSVSTGPLMVAREVD